MHALVGNLFIEPGWDGLEDVPNTIYFDPLDQFNESVTKRKCMPKFGIFYYLSKLNFSSYQDDFTTKADQSVASIYRYAQDEYFPARIRNRTVENLLRRHKFAVTSSQLWNKIFSDPLSFLADFADNIARHLS